jgi:uncharacterized membrane protein
MALLYLVSGANHFMHPEFYRKIMPPWIAWHGSLIFLTGLFEILFAILLLFFRTRRVAAWCIIILLVAVFPANIQMMLNYLHTDNPELWLAILRLPMQIVLIWWAYSFTKPVALKSNSKIIV